MTNLRPLLALFAVLLVAGCQSTKPSPLDEPLVVRFYLEARPATGGVPMQLPVSRILFQVNPKPVIVEYDIVKADLVRVDLGWCLQFHFTPAAARDFYRLTASNINRGLVMTFNDTPVGARRIDQVIADGTMLIFVEVPGENLPPLAEQINRTSAAIAKKAR